MNVGFIRITPAWAGKSFFDFELVKDCQDHPRVGGEKLFDRWNLGPFKGSPPRGRGKAKSDLYATLSSRITPAWAGKSFRVAAGTLHPRDHPRVGGEKCKTLVQAAQKPGSPPRGRGKDFLVQYRLLSQGITPAWAGKSGLRFYSAPVCQDHPRVGGEKRNLIYTLRCPLGSPPRGRGKVLRDLPPLALCRITPAWAGKRPIA